MSRRDFARPLWLLLVAPATRTLACLLTVWFFAGCREPGPVPRIEPSLDGWTEPYAGVGGMRLHVCNTGTMDVPEGLLFRGGSWLKPRSLQALAFVVEHPSHGLVVFDTGLGRAVEDDREAYLGWLMAGVAELSLAGAGTLDRQMTEAGLDPGGVGHVVLSHMHFDHTGALESFSGAEVVVAAAELSDAATAHWPLDYFMEGDWDEVAKWSRIDYSGRQPLATFVAHHDLFGDGSVMLIDLRGHTAGSQGMIVMLPLGPVVLTGDAAWTEESWRYAVRPMMAHDMRLWWEQIWRLKKFVQLVPATLVIPGHDLGQTATARREDILLH